MMNNVSSVGGHLQSIFAFVVDSYEKMIVQLSVSPESCIITIYKPGSSQVHMIFGYPAGDREFYVSQLGEVLAKARIRLAMTDLALKTAVYALKNEW